MLAVERRNRILAQIAQSGATRVKALARRLSVHEQTIRRDLDLLGEQGRLERTHGGALPCAESPFAARATQNLVAKRQIARAAAGHVREGDVIALDASSTARELAEALPDAPLTVITCSLAVVQALHSKPDIRMIVSGGVVDPTTQSLVGPLAERAFERFPSGTLFLSCAGVEFDRGLSLVTHEHARLKRKMIDCAARAILMVDASKLGQRSVEVFAPLADMGLVITDARADLAFVRKLRRAGVAVEVARR